LQRSVQYVTRERDRAAFGREIRLTSYAVPKTRDQRAENRVTCGGAEGCLLCPDVSVTFGP
jgi:hypothetical protein